MNSQGFKTNIFISTKIVSIINGWRVTGSTHFYFSSFYLKSSQKKIIADLKHVLYGLPEEFSNKGILLIN
jgi:hypothetical protein